MKFEMQIAGGLFSLPLETVKELSEYALRNRLESLECEVVVKERRSQFDKENA